ncbi:MAG: mechanosensitive ion channel family protein, partial [Prolixibacteraceae bacterium]
MEEFFTPDFWEELWANGQEWVITELPGLIIIIVVLFILSRFIKFALKKLKNTLIIRAEKKEKDTIAETEKRITTLIGIIGGVVSIFLWAVFLMVALKKFGIEIAPILASAGIVGVAVGFGAQELVRDFFSGFFILLEDQVRAGDVAIINGTGGVVEKIELRTITLRDFSGVVHIFQNGKINTMANMTKEWSAMVFDIGVAYKEDVDEVMQVMRDVGNDLQQDEIFGPSIIEPIEVFGLDQFGDSAIVIKARLKTKPIQQWSVGREYRRRLKIAFDKKGIEIPFPHTTVYWGEDIN